MKKHITVLSLLLLSVACAAQVYTLKPKYSCKLTYAGGSMNELWFEGVNKEHKKTFIVDLDGKTISVPSIVDPEPTVFPLTDISRNKNSNTIRVKVKGRREVGQVWCYYDLKLDKEDNPISITSVERLTGSRFSRDTFFTVYTNDLRTLFFYRECSYVKSNLAVSEDSATMDKEAALFSKEKLVEGDNTIEMRNGYVHWKEGKGRKAMQHHMLVDSVNIVSDAASWGIAIYCQDEAGKYFHISYINTKRQYDPAQTSRQRFIIFGTAFDNKETNRRDRTLMVFR